MNCRKAIFRAAILLLVSLLGAHPAAAQEPRQGPLPAPTKREVTRIPVETTPEAPPIPVEEIIRRLAQKEEEFARARAGYTYRKTIRVQEFGEDNKPSGEFQVTTEPDRKSTRLNSSHGYISYAVFCLKKKNPEDRY